MNESQKTTRRRFLKTGTVVSSMLVSGLALSRSVHARGTEEIRIGTIGAGRRAGGAAAESLKSDPGVRLVAMCDVIEGRARQKRDALAKVFGDRVRCPDDHCFAGFDGYKHVLERCDAVLIACASKFHPMYVEAAIRAGKHVFVEKPHAIDPSGVRRLEAACLSAKEKGLSVVSGMQSRWSIPWRETMKRIHDGQIGEIVAMQSMMLRGPYMPMLPRAPWTEMEYQIQNWPHFSWLSGDDVTQTLVHNIDRMCWAMQGVLPESAFATAGRSSLFEKGYGNLFDHASIVYEYANGTRLFAICRAATGCYQDATDVIMGSDAICLLARNRFVKRNGEEIWRYKGPKNNPYQTEQDELIRSIRTGRAIHAGDYMNSSTMVGVLGQIAAYQGNSIQYDEVAKSDFQFGGLAPDEVDFDISPPVEPDADGFYAIPQPGRTRII